MAKNKVDKFLKLWLYAECITLSSIFVSTIYDVVEINNACIYDDNKLVLSDEEINNIKNKLKPALEGKIPDDSLDDTNVDNYFLLNAIYENDEIDDELKDIYYDLIEIIENSPDLNKEDSYKTLLSLRYEFEEKKVVEGNMVIKGLYSSSAKTIQIFCPDSDLEREHIIEHENIHALFCSSNNRNIPRFFREGITELLVREYLDNDPYSKFSGVLGDFHYTYIPEMTAVKLICELVGSDKVLEAYSKENIKIIYEELEKITGTLDDAKMFIDKMNEVLTNPNELKLTTDDEDIFEQLEIYMNAKFDDQKSIFRSAFNYNLLILKMIYENEEFYSKYNDLVLTLGVFERAYFCEELKNISRNELVEYEDRFLYLNGRENSDDKGFQKIIER